jgi:hypothetical protein
MHRSKQSLYSITSSARASNVGGTVRPSALAVLRLITSSYLVGACTGSSTKSGASPNIQHGFDVEDCVRVAELNRASTGGRVPGARLDRLDLQVCICRSKDIRSQCIA